MMDSYKTAARWNRHYADMEKRSVRDAILWISENRALVQSMPDVKDHWHLFDEIVTKDKRFAGLNVLYKDAHYHGLGHGAYTSRIFGAFVYVQKNKSVEDFLDDLPKTGS